MMDLKQIARDIPHYTEFLTIDEQYASTRQLAADYPTLVTVQTLGHTRRGDPLELISIGEGAQNALVFGGPHPCEPYGCMMIEFLTRQLCQNEALRRALPYRWHFLKCLDLDGMRLNEGWFKGAFSPLHYYSQMFRPLMPEQPEMLFPIAYKTLQFNQPMPETLALRAAIDMTQPRVMLSLHNSELGGVFFYLSKNCPPLQPTLTAIPSWFDLPLDLGESDQAGYVEQFAPAMYSAPSVKQAYEYQVKTGAPNPERAISWGSPSNEYAEERYSTFTLLTEIPFWTEPRINDATPTNVSRREVFRAMVDTQEAFFMWLKTQFEMVKADFKLDTPFHRAVSDRIVFYLGRLQSQRRWVQEASDLSRAATVAEQFRVRYWKEHENQRLRGMFIRLIDAEESSGNRATSFAGVKQHVAERMRETAHMLERELRYQRVPIRSAVGVQLCATLAAVDVMKGA